MGYTRQADIPVVGTDTFTPEGVQVNLKLAVSHGDQVADSNATATPRSATKNVIVPRKPGALVKCMVGGREAERPLHVPSTTSKGLYSSKALVATQRDH